VQGTVGRGQALTIEDRADEGGDLGTGDERGHGDNDQRKIEGATGNMGDDDGNEREGEVEELAEEAGDELRDSEEELEEPAEVRAEVHALEPADEPADDEDDVEYYDRDGSSHSGDEGN